MSYKIPDKTASVETVNKIFSQISNGRYLDILKDLSNGLEMREDSIRKKIGSVRKSISGSMRRSSVFSQANAADEELAEDKIPLQEIDASDMNIFTMALKLDHKFRQKFIKASFDDYTNDKILPILAFAMTATFEKVGDKYQYIPNLQKITKEIVNFCDKEIQIFTSKERENNSLNNIDNHCSYQYGYYQ
jgi:hypothetical protein